MSRLREEEVESGGRTGEKGGREVDDDEEEEVAMFCVGVGVGYRLES